MGNAFPVKESTGKIGHALIISHKIYDESWKDRFGNKPKERLKTRTGNEADVNSLRENLEKYQFQIHEELNLKVAGVKDAIKKFIELDHSSYKCLAVFVMTHGDKRGRLAAFDSEYCTRDIWQPIADCDKLQHIKLKYIAFQACRESKLVDDQKRENAEVSEEESEQLSELHQKLPHKRGFLISFSTWEYRVSFREIIGTYFIQELCKCFTMMKQPTDLLQILNNVTNRVVETTSEGNIGQTPLLVSFLDESFLINPLPEPQTNAPEISSPYSTNGPGYAVIYYVNNFKNDASNLYDILDNLNFEKYMKELDMTKSEKDIIELRNSKTLSKNSCLLIVLFVSFVEHTSEEDSSLKQWLVTEGTSGKATYPLRSYWEHFAYKYPDEATDHMPKLFWFINPSNGSALQARPMQPSTTIEADSIKVKVTQHADLFILKAFGQGFLAELLKQLQKVECDVQQMITRAMRSQEPCKEHSNQGESITHFESSLRAQIVFKPKPKNTTEETTTDGMTLPNVEYTIIIGEDDDDEKKITNPDKWAQKSSVLDMKFRKLQKKKHKILTMNDVDAGMFELLRRHVDTGNKTLDNFQSAIKVMKAAYKYKFDDLLNEASEIVRTNTQKVLESEEFNSISREILEMIVKDDFLSCSELEIHNACMKWARNQAQNQTTNEYQPQNSKYLREVLGPVLKHIRYLTMTYKEFGTGPDKTGILNMEEALSIYRYFATGKFTDMQESHVCSSTEKRSGNRLPMSPVGI